MEESEDLYAFSAKKNDGSDFSFAELRGKPVLIVNTASKCGFTPQYKGLQELHERFGPEGLAVIGFPCDQFAHQEPGSDAEIKEFCSLNYGVSFPLMAKIKVNGPEAHPLYVWLRKRAPGAIGTAVKWNFTKFLVFPDGKTVKRFASAETPEKFVPDIRAALAVMPR
jgi:glutathione peroxidase